MSEVSPIVEKCWGKQATIKYQAKAWYGIDITSYDYGSSAVELEKQCIEKGLYLVIRDWPTGYFLPLKENNKKPAGSFLGYEILSSNIKIVPFLFVRDSIDVWLSMGAHAVEGFFPFYREYIEKALKIDGIKVFKYEEFITDPEAVLCSICNHCGIIFPSMPNNYVNVTNVTGDIQLKSKSRGWNLRKIGKLPRKRISRGKIKKINACNDMIYVNNLLGYPTRYEAADIEPYWQYFKEKKKKYIIKKIKPIIDFLNNYLFCRRYWKP